MAEAPAGSSRQVHLLEAQVGAHTLLFHPDGVLAVEPGGERLEDGFIVRLDLRAWLRTPPSRPAGDCLLVAGDTNVYRLIVCAVRQLLRSEVRQLHRVPPPLAPLARRLGLGGIARLDGQRLAYLVDPLALALVCARERVGAA